jgi:hypothetical protein
LNFPGIRLRLDFGIVAGYSGIRIETILIIEKFTAMKKLFVVSLTMSLLNLDLAATGQTQTPRKKQNPDVTVFFEKPGLEKFPIEKTDFSSSPLNSISVKAVRDFDKSFAHAYDKQWYVLEDGLVVYFKLNEIQMKTFYDKRGDRILTLRFYGEEKLPFNVRDLVKRNYYDHQIFLVIEINSHDKNVYLVKMEDKHSWKTVRVEEGEYVEVESYRKVH